MKPPLRASLIAWPIRLAPPFRGDEPLLASLLSNQLVTRPAPAGTNGSTCYLDCYEKRLPLKSGIAVH